MSLLLLLEPPPSASSLMLVAELRSCTQTKFLQKIAEYEGEPVYDALCVSASTLIQVYSLKSHLVSMSFPSGEVPGALPA